MAIPAKKKAKALFFSLFVFRTLMRVWGGVFRGEFFSALKSSGQIHEKPGLGLRLPKTGLTLSDSFPLKIHNWCGGPALEMHFFLKHLTGLSGWVPLRYS